LYFRHLQRFLDFMLPRCPHQGSLAVFAMKMTIQVPHIRYIANRRRMDYNRYRSQTSHKRERKK